MPGPIESRGYALHMAGCADAGFVRQANEDSVGCFDGRLAIVVDAMGGNAAGTVAGPMILSLLRVELRELRPDDDAPLAATLRDAVVRANADFRRSLEALGNYGRGIGAAVGALWLCGRRAAFAHAGDTRMYRWRGGELEQIGREHSLLREMEDRPDYVMTDEARASAQRYANVITRAFGVSEDLDPEVVEVDLRPGDRYLLCSDGLWRTLDDRRIAAIVAAHPSLDEAVRALTEEAIASPSSDNVAVVFAEVRDDATPAPSAARTDVADDDALPVDALRARHWRPERDRVDEVDRCLAAHAEVADAWESLASRGLIPLRWTESTTRRFLGGEREEAVPASELVRFARSLVASGSLLQDMAPVRDGASTVRWWEASALPSSVAALALFAADVEGVERAEVLLDEAAVRLRPFGYASPQRHLWGVADARMQRSSPWPTILDGDVVAGFFDVEPYVGGTWWSARRPPLPDKRADTAGLLFDADDAWTRPTGRPVPSWCSALRGHAFADLPSPFRPLREIVALGYVAQGLTLSGRVLLVAAGEAPAGPPIAAPANAPATRPWWRFWQR